MTHRVPARTPAIGADPADAAYQAAVTAAHHQLQQSVVDARTVRAPVSDSWRRSLNLHRSPESVVTPSIISSDALAAGRRSHPLAEVLPLVETMLAPARDVGLIVALSNADGHLLWVDGGGRTRREAEAIGFTPGADWSEASMGTSAPGAALSTGAAAQVAGAEHFSHAVHRFYCSAVPLRHPSGKIMGMVDLTGSTDAITPLAVSSLAHTARLVENYWATHTFPFVPTSDESASTQAGLIPAPSITVAADGPSRLGNVRLSLRHAEILTLLDWRWSGLSAVQLAQELFGEVPASELPARLTTVRAEISRLRKLLRDAGSPFVLESQPYRISEAGGVGATTDARQAMAALNRGDLAAALRLAPAEVLPDSEAPGVVEIRHRLAATVRESVLADATSDELWTYLATPQAAYDVEAWQLALRILPATSRRRAIVTATLNRLLGWLG